MTHSFHLTGDQEDKFKGILAKHKDMTKTAVICKYLFGRRDRNSIKLSIIDVAFLSNLSNLLDSLGDNADRGNSIVEDLEELKTIVRVKLESL